MTNKLLTRDQFREGVFSRDNYSCVLCKKPAKDAHHIMERRLFSDGGYYLDNGASLCEEHHIMAEQTIYGCEDIRLHAGILTTVLPEHLYDDMYYDKWGNPIIGHKQRLKGELFFDESVQKILKEGNVLDQFVNRFKYPRTYHCPWSPGLHKDDKMIPNMDSFVNKRVIVTEKMDGENTTMYQDYIHARSIDGRNHPSRDWVKNFWSSICHEIPIDWRICGENLYALHSISYNDLETYFYGFSIWDEFNMCLSWNETQDWFQLLGIKSVPVLYDGIYDERKIKSLYDDKKDYDNREGYVIRLADKFSYRDFKTSVVKYVRKDHIRTTKHWMQGKSETNKLKE